MGDVAAENKISDTTQQGSFLAKGDAYTVILTSNTLSWSKVNGGEEAEFIVPISEIISTKTFSSKKEGDEIDGWNVCYIRHEEKHVLRRCVISFHGHSETCTEWVNYIQHYIDDDQHRPRKMLVIVNPISGSGKGKQTYMTKVDPLFQEADIHTDVIVTERSGHATEILSHYELESVDSIVFVGGDGLYHEGVNGLLRRKALDGNCDVNKPDDVLPDVDIPIGIIPCGTGNGAAQGCYGNKDIETAALAIIIGKKSKTNVLGVHSAGELVGYSMIMVGYGFWGDILYAAEAKRSQGFFRYLISMLQWVLFKSPRLLNVTIDYLPDRSTISETSPSNLDSARDELQLPVEKVNTAEETQDQLKSEDSPHVDTGDSVTKEIKSKLQPGDKKMCDIKLITSERWEAATGTFTGLLTPFPFDVFAYSQGRTRDEGMDSMRMLNTKPVGKWAILKFVHQLMSINPDVLNNGSIEHLLVKEYKVTLDKTSNPDVELGRKERVLCLDGEMFILKKPEYHVKLYKKKILLYSSVQADHLMLPKTERWI